MNIEAAFARLAPALWSEMLGLPPIERARRFSIPLEEDFQKVTIAKALVSEVVAGHQTNAGVRWKYSGANEKKAECFDLAASFYYKCFCAMRDILQEREPSIVEMWPCVEFDYSAKCHATCASLKGKRLPRNNAAVRTFYPPWHFGCNSYISDSSQKGSRDFTLSMRPAEMQYFHNPIDILVSQGLIDDFPGLDFGSQSSIVCDLTKFHEGLTRR